MKGPGTYYFDLTRRSHRACILISSYLSAISEVITDAAETCDGMAKNDMGEARLDIIDSEINREYACLSDTTCMAYPCDSFALFRHLSTDEASNETCK